MSDELEAGERVLELECALRFAGYPFAGLWLEEHPLTQSGTVVCGIHRGKRTGNMSKSNQST